MFLALAGLASGLIKGFIGSGQKRKALALMKKNKLPAYEIPAEAVQAASEGLPSAQYNQAMQNIQRQQSNAIAASQDRRGGLANITRTQQLTNDAIGNLDAANAKARQQNLIRLGQYKEKAWDWNKKQKFLDDRQYAMSLLGAGNQNVAVGIDSALSGLASFGGKMGGNGGGNNSLSSSYAAADGVGGY